MMYLAEEVADLVSDSASIPWGILTPSGLLLYAVWALLTGRIIPRRTHEDTLEEIKHLRRTVETMQEVKVQLAQQNTKLLGDRDLSVQMLQSARAEGERDAE